jgi:hypothetical protein
MFLETLLKEGYPRRLSISILRNYVIERRSKCLAKGAWGFSAVVTALRARSRGVRLRQQRCFYTTKFCSEELRKNEQFYMQRERQKVEEIVCILENDNYL